MNCPDCKDKELLPARSREDRKEADALKCVYCSKMFQMDKTNHLRPFSVEVPAATHTAEIMAAGLHPRSEIAVGPKPADPPATVKDKIDEDDKVEIFKRLVLGEKPCAIAAAIGCKPQAVNNYKFVHKKSIEAARSAVSKGDSIAEGETKTVNKETNKPETETDPPALEKKLSYNPAEKLVIIAEAETPGVKCKELCDKYGISEGQLQGWRRRKKYYRQVVDAGLKNIRASYQHKSFILSQVRNIESIPVGKVRGVLVEYHKILTVDLGIAKEEVKSVKNEMQRVSAAIDEFDSRTAACQAEVVKVFKRGVS